MTTDEISAINESLSGLLAAAAGTANFRDHRDKNISFDENVWCQLKELGWTGLIISEAYGGQGMGAAGAVAIGEQMGSNLVLAPMISSCIVSSFVIETFGTEDQKQAWLPRLASGDGITVFVPSTPRGISRRQIKAVEEGSTYSITGEAELVLDAEHADSFLVLATEGAKSDHIFYVARDAKKLQIDSYTGIDGRSYAHLKFDNLVLDKSCAMQAPQMQLVWEFGAVVYSSELYGAARSAFDLTQVYVTQRQQFGRLIGSYQALQVHRACDDESAFRKSGARIRSEAG